MHTSNSILLIAACAAALAAMPAAGDDVPKRKSGLWEITTQSGAAKTPPHSVQLCVDQKTDNAAQHAAAGAAKDMCTRNDLVRQGDRIVVDSVCKFGESTAPTHAVMSGHFDSAYRVETTSKYDPPLAGIREGSAVIEAKWLGPCKADQKPGDMILSNGMKININDPKGQVPPVRPASGPNPAPKQ
jgi:hypothetical protein